MKKIFRFIKVKKDLGTNQAQNNLKAKLQISAKKTRHLKTSLKLKLWKQKEKP